MLPPSPGVYIIKQPRTRQFYIGSSINMYRRWINHSRALAQGRHKNRHLQAAAKCGPLRVEIVELLPSGSGPRLCRAAEQRHLRKVRRMSGCMNLCFDAYGGEPSAETIERIRSKLRGRTFTAEHRAKISAAMRGRFYSAETRAKIGAYSAMRVHSRVTRERISASLTGRAHSPKTRARIAESNRRTKRARRASS